MNSPQHNDLDYNNSNVPNQVLHRHCVVLEPNVSGSFELFSENEIKSGCIECETAQFLLAICVHPNGSSSGNMTLDCNTTFVSHDLSWPVRFSNLFQILPLR